METLKLRQQVLFSNILELMQTESFPDCRLVTRERLAVEAHKIMLFQSPYLRSLLTSVACCEGQCGAQEPVTILLPEVSYTHLEPVLHYLYTGVLKVDKSDKAGIRDLLLKTFRIPGERESPTSRPGEVTCEECSARVHVTELLSHVVKKHVKQPFLRDLRRAEEGRVVEGIAEFDLTTPSQSVIDHYRVSCNAKLRDLREAHGICGDHRDVFQPDKWQEKGRWRRISKPSQDSSQPKSNTKDKKDGTVDPRNKENQAAGQNEGSHMKRLRATVTDHVSNNVSKTPRLNSTTHELYEVNKHSDIHTKTPMDVRSLENLKEDPSKKTRHKSGRDNPLEKRSKSSRLRLKSKPDEPTVQCVPSQNKTGKVICQECRTEVSRQTFSKHLVAKHLYKLWPHIKQDETVCRKKDCNMVCESSKYLIQHMALKHNELDTKLGELGRTLADYMWSDDDREERGEEQQENLVEIGDVATESGSDATQPLGFGEEERMADFD